MKHTVSVQSIVKRNPDGAVDFRAMAKHEMQLCVAIGKRSHDMAAAMGGITDQSLAHLNDILTASMLVASIFLLRGKRYDLLRLLESDPLSFWDEMKSMASNFRARPIAFFPDTVKLRFAQTSALH